MEVIQRNPGNESTLFKGASKDQVYKVVDKFFTNEKEAFEYLSYVFQTLSRLRK